jgi:allantoate deiminase
MNYSERAEDVMNRIKTLAGISDEPNCITRTFGSPAFKEGSLQVQQWMQEAGLETRIDNIGNVRGRLKGSGKKTLVIASHIDTVINAGAFDGPLGVLMGIDIVTQLKDPLPFNIEVIAFCDEEGVRFHTTYLGSKVVAGTFDNSLLDKKDADGITLGEVINGEHLDLDAIPADEWKAYFEIHIEQGPVLYERNIPVAVVSAIAAQQRSIITIKGMAGHAGTVPMNQRQDALCGAAEFVLAAEKWAIQNEIVATVGIIHINHAASNVIPGEVTCSLDIRSVDENMQHIAHTALEKAVDTICKQRGLTFEWRIIQETKPVWCNDLLRDLLSQSISAAGYEPLALLSGAGHDAVAVSAVSPVCMLFVRCFKGISHHPQENVLAEDIATALQVSDQFMLHLIKSS